MIAVARELSRALLGAVLAAAAVLKLIGGHDPSWFVGAGVHRALALVELALGALLFTRWANLAALLTLALSAGGIATVWLGHSARCGCLGRLVVLDARTHLALAAALGVLACVVLMKPRRVPEHAGRTATGSDAAIS